MKAHYYNSKPRHYRRTLGKQMAQDFYNSGWMAFTSIIILSIGFYLYLINYADDTASLLNSAWVVLLG